MLRVTYQLASASRDDAQAKASDIALEQTAELPAAAVPADIDVVGDVEQLEQSGQGQWRAVIAFDPGIVGDDLSQLLNVLFGNISLKTGIVVVDVSVPASLLARFSGPAFGVSGLRQLCGVARRPMLCTALKPMGLSPERLADLAYRFAAGGLDIIKDDHGVTDQASAPFEDRVIHCQEAVHRANAETGGQALYFPNVTAGPKELARRVEVARSAGCRGVMVSPMLTGLDALQEVVAPAGLAMFTHPTLTGGFFYDDHGIAPDVLFGLLLRLAGADGVIYPNAGGRFRLTDAQCSAINDRLRAPLGSIRPSFPVAGGGIDAARVPEWVQRYGLDTIFLVGSSLYVQGDVRRAAARLAHEVRKHE